MGTDNMLIIARDNTVDDISYHNLIVSLTGESPEASLRPLLSTRNGVWVYRTARTHTLVQISPRSVLVCQ